MMGQEIMADRVEIGLHHVLKPFKIGLFPAIIDPHDLSRHGHAGNSDASQTNNIRFARRRDLVNHRSIRVEDTHSTGGVPLIAADKPTDGVQIGRMGVFVQQLPVVHIPGRFRLVGMLGQGILDQLLPGIDPGMGFGGHLCLHPHQILLGMKPTGVNEGFLC